MTRRMTGRMTGRMNGRRRGSMTSRMIGRMKGGWQVGPYPAATATRPSPPEMKRPPPCTAQTPVTTLQR
eukprot:2739695-Rhodomonas_salina.1